MSRNRNINSILSGAAKKSPKKSKSKVPIVEVDKSTQEIITDYINIMKDMETTKTKAAMLSNDIITAVTPLRENLCKENYETTVKIPDKDGNVITVSYQHKYSKADPEIVEDIEKIIGEDKFDRWFSVNNIIKVKNTTDEKLNELIDLIGEERFGEFFSVEQNLVPKEAYTKEKIIELPKDDRDELDTLIRPYSPSIRTK